MARKAINTSICSSRLREGDSLSKQPQNPEGGKAGTFERNMLETAKGGGFLAAGTLFAFGSRFVLAFFLARLLGAEQYGTYQLAISAAVIVASISTIGLDSTMVRYIAMYDGLEDDKRLWGTLQIGIAFSVLTSILLSIGLYALARPVAIGLFREPELARFLQLFSVFIPFSTLSSVLLDAARGFKRMDYSALAENVVLFVSRMALIGLLAISGLDAYKAVIAFGLSDVAVAISLIYLLNKEFSLRRSWRQSRYEFREIFWFALPFWMSGLLSKFRKNIQTLLLGTLNTVTSVGIFSIASKVNLVGRIVYRSTLASVKPFLAALYGQENEAQMARLYKTTTRWTFTANLPLFLVMVLFPAELLSIFGRSFAAGASALAVLACAELLNAATGICGSIIDMTGYTKMKLANSVIWVVLISVTNVLLIPRWGVLGAAAAELIAMGTVNVLRVLQVWFIFGMHPYELSFLKPTAAAMASAGATVLLGLFLPGEPNFLLTAFRILTLFVVYAGVLLLLGLAPEERTVLNRSYRRTRALLGNFQGALHKYLATRTGAG